jgi:desulfoferrodoxin (superoxide reductase-like protein)
MDNDRSTILLLKGKIKMKKFKITIEETIDQDFEIEANSAIMAREYCNLHGLWKSV